MEKNLLSEVNEYSITEMYYREGANSINVFVKLVLTPSLDPRTFVSIVSLSLENPFGLDTRLGF